MFTLQRYGNNHRNVMFCLLFINIEKPYVKLKFRNSWVDNKEIRHTPREWFIAPLKAIEQAISLLDSEGVVNYKYSQEDEVIVSNINHVRIEIKNYNVNEKSIFTWNNFVLVYLFFAVLCYPVLILGFLSFTWQ